MWELKLYNFLSPWFISFLTLFETLVMLFTILSSSSTFNFSHSHLHHTIAVATAPPSRLHRATVTAAHFLHHHCYSLLQPPLSSTPSPSTIVLHLISSLHHHRLWFS
ncbi:hypothetical protein RIF29_39595 [Crotalaria pallida]|uniref:Uncharacterized protein n=1 Tax=Crotalaria pallida TaxID=3830 RepID=A0AAN9HPR6_CROPI